LWSVWFISGVILNDFNEINRGLQELIGNNCEWPDMVCIYLKSSLKNKTGWMPVCMSARTVKIC